MLCLDWQVDISAPLMLFIAVANLQLMFPDAPVRELERIVDDSLDFDQALEVVLHRFGNKTTPSQDITMNIPSREAEFSANQDCYGEAAEFPHSIGMSVCIPSFLGNSS
jgi:hypothetical protein